MRVDIVHPGAYNITYEIREIVAVAKKLEALGVVVNWENIGDPVAKGISVPDWIKKIVQDLSQMDKSWGYSPTKGLLETREYLAEIRNGGVGVKISPEDILFFNGLGDAIQTSFMYLHPRARVIGPSPAYPSHSSAEAAHAGGKHLTYKLLPNKGWLPDLHDLRQQLKYHPEIAGILLINPDNPTGTVYPPEVLEGMVSLAKEFNLFIMSDEIYGSIVYGKQKMISLSEVLGDVPGLTFKGLSKEIPWPGSRCGWVEFYNLDKDENFARFAKALVDAKQLEVCSTTLPQLALPKILSHSNYKKHLQALNDRYAERADFLEKVFKDVEEVIFVKPQGAFYATPVFKKGVLNHKQTLALDNEKVRDYINLITTNVSPDRRFVYYLLAATGICVVPLSGLNSQLDGFRITLLENDFKKFQQTAKALVTAIKRYIQSTK